MKKYLIILIVVLLQTATSAQKSSDKYIVKCTNQEYSNTIMTFDIEITNNRFRRVKAWISEGNLDENNNWFVKPEISSDSIQLKFEYELVEKGRDRKLVKPKVLASSSSSRKGLRIRGKNSQVIKAKVTVQGDVSSMKYLQFFIAIKEKKDTYIIKSVEFNFLYLKFIYA